MTKVLLLEGLRQVDPSTPVLRADDLGVLRGEAVFETVRIAGGRPALLAAHLQRLASSAERLEIPLPGGWEELAHAASKGQEEAVLRLVCTKGPPPVGFALVTEIPVETLRARTDGVRVITLTLGITAQQRSAAAWLLGGIKSTSYAVNMASVRHAQEQGADDAIWVSSDGEVLEAPTATVAIIRAGTLATPPPSVGILPGTTLAAVLDLALVPATVRRIPLSELQGADEVMLLSSVRGIAPVTAIDGRELGIGPVTARLRDAFETSLRSH